MARGDGTGADVLQVGPQRRAVRPAGWSRWVALLAAGVIAVVGMAQARTDPRPVGAAAPSVASAPPVAVTDLGHPVLYAVAGWELFGRGADEVVRIEVARGRVTRTAVPALHSDAPVSFVVTADRAVVRSFDRVPGYVVPDGQPARTAPGGADPAPPGPEPPDLRRVTTGRLLAAGPTRWLALECDRPHGCRPVTIDRATGSRRTVPAALRPDPAAGVIAPDGRTAAMFGVRDDGTVTPYLLDLASGVRRPTDLPIDDAVADGTVVWSPDSRWLFVAGSDGAIWAVDPATAQVTMLGVTLAPPGQLAVRPRHG